MPSPSLSGSLTKVLSPKFASARELPASPRPLRERRTETVRSPEAGVPAAPVPVPVPVPPAPEPPTAGSSATAPAGPVTVGPVTVGPVTVGPCAVRADDEALFESRCGALRSVAVEIFSVSPREGESAFGHSFQPISGTAIAPMPSTGDQARGQRAGEPEITAGGRSAVGGVSVGHVRVPFHRMTR